MRILLVVHGLPPEAVGGVEQQCHFLAVALGREHSVGVFCRRADQERPDYALDEQRREGFTVWYLNHRYSDLTSFTGIYRNRRIDDIFDTVLGQWSPDIVHVQHLIGLSLGIMERTKARGIPLVLSLHDFWFGCPRGQRIREGLKLCETIDRRLCVACLKPQNYEIRSPRRPLMRWLATLRAPTRRRGRAILRRYDADVRRVLALPDAIVTPARSHLRMYLGYGVDGRRAHVIDCGLAPAAAARTESPRGRPHRVGFLGTLIPSKGPHLLLEAYRLLARPEVTLDFYGAHLPFHGDTGYLDRLKAAAASIPGTIRFHGRYEAAQVPDILASLDVLVVPSLWYECSPIVIREGFRSGVPVIAAGHGGMAEAIEHGVNGLLFAPGSAADLAAQLRRLLDDPELWRRLAAYPHRVTTIDQYAARHLELYRRLLGERGRRTH